MAQVVLGDVVERLGPHLRGTPRQAVVVEEAQMADRAEALAEDLAVDQVTEPATDEGVDKDPVGPERLIQSSISWRGCPSVWSRRLMPRDGVESMTGISSSGSDESCPRLTWGPRSRNS